MGNHREATVKSHKTSGMSAFENAQIQPATAKVPAIAANVHIRSLGTRRH